MYGEKSMFSNHTDKKLESNSRGKNGKLTNKWTLNNIHPNNQWIKEEVTRKIRKHFEIHENEGTTH